MKTLHRRDMLRALGCLAAVVIAPAAAAAGNAPARGPAFSRKQACQVCRGAPGLSRVASHTCGFYGRIEDPEAALRFVLASAGATG